MPFIERDGTRIVYEAGGAGPGTILLAHNILCDRRVFAGLVERLQGRFRLLNVDLRGQGESPVPARAYSAADLAADLAAVLDAERVEKAAVAGLSLGATAALELVLSRPERVSALVLMGATAREDELRIAARNAFLSPLVRTFGVRGPILKKAVTSLFGASYRSEASAELQEWTRRIAALPPRAAYCSLRAWRLRRSFASRLGEIKPPTLIVVGDEDVACTLPEGEELQRGIAGSRLARVARAGHTMTAERPAETAAVLGDFLDSIGFGKA